jgi:NADH-quinone oxidoreductase subunit M
MGLGMHALGISLKLGLNGISMPLFVMAAVVGFAAGLYALAPSASASRPSSRCCW